MATDEQEKLAHELYGQGRNYDTLSEWGKFAVDQEIGSRTLSSQDVPRWGDIKAPDAILRVRVAELENTVARLQEENYDYALEIEELKAEIERQRPQP